MSTAALGMAELAAGDLPTATRHLDEASTALGNYGEIIGLPFRFRFMHAEALARSGRTDAAAAALESADRCRHPAYVYVESGYLLARAWVAAAQRHLTKAHEEALAAAAFARDHGQWAREVLALQTVALFGDGTVAGRLAGLTDLVEGPRAAVATRFARALAANDAAELTAASDDFDRIGDRLSAADAAAHAAVSHRGAGRRGSALTESSRAHRIALDCGGAVSPALSSARIPLPFTQREHEVAQLVSRGLSNRDIASTLSLSVRTVEGYVYQASAKAGVTARAELAALVQQFG
jgi:DNA-binding CsgD family transcriptional regulator